MYLAQRDRPFESPYSGRGRAFVGAGRASGRHAVARVKSGKLRDGLCACAEGSLSGLPPVFTRPMSGPIRSPRWLVSGMSSSDGCSPARSVPIARGEQADQHEGRYTARMRAGPAGLTCRAWQCWPGLVLVRWTAMCCFPAACTRPASRARWLRTPGRPALELAGSAGSSGSSAACASPGRGQPRSARHPQGGV